MRKLALAFLLSVFPMMAFAANVNINSASKNELMSQLEGVTEQQADAIIKYRESQGPFVKLHELYFVEGVDRDIISPNYNRLTVGDVNWGDKKS